MQTKKEDGQVSLFDRDTDAGRMCSAPFPVHQEGISKRSSKRLSGSRNHRLILLDLRPGAGNLLGPSWEPDSPSLGESSMLNTGPRPHNEGGASSLLRILEEHPPRKYYLSKAACLGILRRAEQRGKALPSQLKEALELQAGVSSPSTSTSGRRP